MAAVERKHAAIWEDRLKAAAVPIPIFVPNWRTRTLAWVAKHLGVGAVLPTVMGNERKDTRKYAHTPGGAEMGADEASHNRLLSHVASTMKGGMEGGELAQLQGRQRAGGGDALRGGGRGANDGLVSNLSLVMGVAGGALNNSTILITAFCGFV